MQKRVEGIQGWGGLALSGAVLPPCGHFRILPPAGADWRRDSRQIPGCDFSSRSPSQLRHPGQTAESHSTAHSAGSNCRAGICSLKQHFQSQSGCALYREAMSFAKFCKSFWLSLAFPQPPFAARTWHLPHAPGCVTARGKVCVGLGTD